MPCTEWESLPRQLLSAASKVSPAEHSQAKLPRVLRQIPFLHKPGNWVHSSISTTKNHSLKYSWYTLPHPESTANGRIHTRDGLWNSHNFGWTIPLTLSICFRVNFDGFWRGIIHLRRIRNPSLVWKRTMIRVFRKFVTSWGIVVTKCKTTS